VSQAAVRGALPLAWKNNVPEDGIPGRLWAPGSSVERRPAPAWRPCPLARGAGRCVGDML